MDSAEMEIIEPLIYLYSSKPVSPLVSNLSRCGSSVLVFKNENDVTFFNENIFLENFESNMIMIDFPIADLIDKFQQTFLDNITSFLNKKNKEEHKFIINWNREIFRNMMYLFSKTNWEDSGASVKSIFSQGMFTSGEDYVDFEKKFKTELGNYFKEIQESTFSEDPKSSDKYVGDKTKANIYVVQEYENIWKTAKKRKPLHRISICKNPKKFLNNLSRKKQKGTGSYSSKQ